MKSFDSRIYSISDILEWDRNNQLELNPKFQRRSVWTDNARSYLMDTIIRGKPIPKIFLRQKINPSTKTAVREVVDGQQRLRTILSFVKDGFQVSKKQNSRYGGFFFSQLDQIDDQIQTNILNYEISADLLTNLPDEEILDIFTRLNSYSVVLNEQEKINADHFGPFKTIADEIAHRYNNNWLKNRILSDAQIIRMGDVSLVADLLIAMIEGIKSKKQLKFYYDLYEKQFSCDVEELSRQFDAVMQIISDIFPESLSNTEFRRVHIFYSLFTTIYHLEFGLKNIGNPAKHLNMKEYPRIRSLLEEVETIFDAEDIKQLEDEQAQFLEDSRRATTDATVRIRRTEYLIKQITL
jgi:hypothetical protein